MIAKNIGRKIKVLRAERDLNQEEFAAKIGVRQATVSSWEQGKNTVSTELLVKICQVFNIDLSYFNGVGSDNASTT